jgi:hypothetical protein
MSSLESGITESTLGLGSDEMLETALKNTVAHPDNYRQDLIEDHVFPKLDPAFARYFLEVLSKQPPAHLIPLEDVRADPDRHRAPIATDSAKSERVADHLVSSQDGATITVRVYHPDPEKFGPGPYPVHMNHHGGSLSVACS